MPNSLPPHLLPLVETLNQQLTDFWLRIIAESRVILTQMASEPTNVSLITALADNVMNLSRINDCFLIKEAAFNADATTPL